MDLGKYLDRVRERNPLIHHITNYVTVNDCANLTLALGASPVMADDPAEAADMTEISDALVINIGTLNARTVESMLATGRKANEKGIPVIFDPVGCGATRFRTETAKRIAGEIRLAVVRGNISEIGALCGISSHTKGVDAIASDRELDAAEMARNAARRLACVTVITGAVDVVTDGARIVLIENGVPEMAHITGTGCMCTSAIAAFCAAAEGNLTDAAAAAVTAMGLCGEIAWKRAEGLGSFHTGIFDAAGNLDGAALEKGAKIYETRI